MVTTTVWMMVVSVAIAVGAKAQIMGAGAVVHVERSENRLAVSVVAVEEVMRRVLEATETRTFSSGVTNPKLVPIRRPKYGSRAMNPTSTPTSRGTTRYSWGDGRSAHSVVCWRGGTGGDACDR